MKTIVLLRGVNVGGRNKLPMKTFAMVLERLGAENVRTYIQSGNAVMDGEASANDIAAALKKHAGVSCHVFTLPAARLKKLAAASPFAKEAEASPKSVHLYLLGAKPDAEAVERLAVLKTPSEDIALAGDALYLHTPAGLAKSNIAERIDRTLKVTTTARNWNTVNKLIELAGVR